MRKPPPAKYRFKKKPMPALPGTTPTNLPTPPNPGDTATVATPEEQQAFRALAAQQSSIEVAMAVLNSHLPEERQWADASGTKRLGGPGALP